jgi:hypothetical protein
MKLGIILSNPDPESAFNSLRLANYSRKQNDEVRVFQLRRLGDLPVVDDAGSVRDRARLGPARHVLRRGGTHAPASRASFPNRENGEDRTEQRWAFGFHVAIFQLTGICP